MSQEHPLMNGWRYRVPADDDTSYITHTVPVLHPKSYILAATSPWTGEVCPKVDGRFLSEFFAFNAVLKGVGTEQSWLTIACIDYVIAMYKEFVHGNPHGDSRVVLSRKLLETNQITEPTDVWPGHLKAEFIQRAQSLSKRAARDGVPLVLLLFCHSTPAPNFQFRLDGMRKPGLAPLELKAALEPSARVILITTACYSSGWMIEPDFNRSIAKAESECLSWPLLRSPVGYPGSVFASSLIKILTSAASPLVDQSQTRRPSSREEPLQPDVPSEVQVSTYKAFCAAIWETCMRLTRTENSHELLFGRLNDCWDDSWPDIASIPIDDYQRRWNALPVRRYNGPLNRGDHYPRNPDVPLNAGTVADDGVYAIKGLLVENIKCHNLKDLAQIYGCYTSPGDWHYALNTDYQNLLRSCQEYKRPDVIPPDERNPDGEYYRWTDEVEMYASIIFRCEWSFFADFIVQKFKLPRPFDQECLFWDIDRWNAESQGRMHRYDPTNVQVFQRLLLGGLCERSSLAQGPPFLRPARYLTSAIALARLPVATQIILVDRIIACMNQVRLFEEERVMPSLINDPDVRRRAESWLATLGGGIRLAQPDHGERITTPANGQGANSSFELPLRIKGSLPTQEDMSRE